MHLLQQSSSDVVKELPQGEVALSVKGAFSMSNHLVVQSFL